MYRFARVIRTCLHTTKPLHGGANLVFLNKGFRPGWGRNCPISPRPTSRGSLNSLAFPKLLIFLTGVATSYTMYAALLGHLPDRSTYGYYVFAAVLIIA